jgi:hypothetical protein
VLGGGEEVEFLVGRAVRRCASGADLSRPFDTKLVLCRIILMSSNQGAGAARRRGRRTRTGRAALTADPVRRAGPRIGRRRPSRLSR